MSPEWVRRSHTFLEEPALVLRRIIAIAVIAIGLAAIVGAVGSATFWRPDERVTATLPSTPEEPVVITAPGVLDMVDDTVEVRVIGQSPQTPVLLAMGREADVRAWLDDAPYLEITGLTTWEEFSVERVQAAPDGEEDAAEDGEGTDGETGSAEGTEDTEGTEDSEGTDEPADDEAAEGDSAAEEGAEGDESLPDPAGSDLWLEEVTGTGEVTYEWTAVPGRWVLLAATDGTGAAPRVELTWEREVPTPLLVPGTIIGVVLVLGGAAALVIFLLADREAARARQARAAQAAAAAIPARPPARHREDVPEEELTYAQRLGWPSVTAAETTESAESDETAESRTSAPDDATETIAPVAGTTSSEATSASSPGAPTVSSSADTGELPSGLLKPDGTPMTRRELREREKARLEAERAKTRRRWWPFGGRTDGDQGDADQAPEADAGPGNDSDAGTGRGSDLGAGTGRGNDLGAGTGRGNNPSADGAATLGPGQAADGDERPGGGAGAELSDWVASSRGPGSAGTTGVYGSGARTTVRDSAGDETGGLDAVLSGGTNDHGAAGGDAENEHDRTTGKPLPWWRRFARAALEEEPEPQVQAAPEPDSDDEQEPDPHISGARWRKTWGIVQEPGQRPFTAAGAEETAELPTQTSGGPARTPGRPTGAEGGRRN